MHEIKPVISPAVFHNIIRGPFDALIKVKITGAENIPKEGPLLIIANHSSYLDIPLIAKVFDKEISRLSWIISKENYKHLIMKWVFLIYKVILVNGTVEKVKKELKLNRWVVVFPEGAGRWCCGGDEKKIKPRTGTAAIALSTGATMLPVCISKLDKKPLLELFRMGPVVSATINIGKPFAFEAVDQDKIDQAFLDKKTIEIMNRIKELVDKT